MGRWKVVLTDHEFEDFRYEEAVFKDYPIDFIVGQCKTEEEVIALTKDADGVLNVYAPISEAVIAQMTHCKVISRYGIGVDTIDIDAATEHRIQVTNVTDYGVEEVANHTLGLILACSRKIVDYDRYVKSGNWDFKLGMPIHRISNQTIGLIGFGRIPRLLLTRLLPLGFNVCVYDPYVDSDEVRSLGARSCSLHELLQASDFVSIHAPATKDNFHLIGRNELSLMKSTSYLINTSRGALIDEEALLDALRTKKIQGAALDVIQNEPIPSDHPFLELDNIILTPHAAWYSEESMVALRTNSAQNIVDVLCGVKPKYAVNSL